MARAADLVFSSGSWGSASVRPSYPFPRRPSRLPVKENHCYCNNQEVQGKRSSLIPKILMSAETVIHTGGCHCRHVRWQVEASPSVVAWNCNCSICSMRANTNFIVPSAKFKLIGDSEKFLTTYTFGTHKAKHTFCKICGITSFYFPRSNPDGVGVSVKCVDSGTLRHVEIRYFDGINWERSYDQSSIASLSKSSGISHQ